LGVQSESANEIVLAFGLDRSGVPENLAALWSHHFKLTYTVTLSADSLKTRLTAENTGDDEFTFTSLLHTYFRVENIDHVRVKGLKGKTYNEKIYNKVGVIDNDDEIAVSAELDRNYFDVPNQGISVVENGTVTASLSTSGFDDVVVWNPWIEKAKSLADFPDEGYKNMICVEVGQIGKPVTLKKGEKWVGEQHIR
ncbi:galactose mutarotase-like domain-containing protein, partial [Chytriomyces sp. MP71]